MQTIRPRCFTSCATISNSRAHALAAVSEPAAHVPVLVDGNAVQSCDIPLSAAAGRQVTTIEGIGSIAKMHALQSAFIAEQAAQCGYCTSGIIMTAYALLARNPRPSESEICTALDGNLCRCGSHGRVLRAVKRAAQQLAP